MSRRQRTEAKIAREQAAEAFAAIAAARIAPTVEAVEVPEDEAVEELDLDAELVGQPLPGEVEPTREAVERALERDSEAWTRFAASLDSRASTFTGDDDWRPEAVREERERAEQKTEYWEKRAAKAINERERRRAEAHAERHDREARRLRRLLSPSVVTGEELAPGRPRHFCRLCGAAMPDASARWEHERTCNRTADPRRYPE